MGLTYFGWTRTIDMFTVKNWMDLSDLEGLSATKTGILRYHQTLRSRPQNIGSSPAGGMQAAKTPDFLANPGMQRSTVLGKLMSIGKSLFAITGKLSTITVLISI